MSSKLTGLYSKLYHLAQNLWWSWDPEATALFERLDPEVWEASSHSALAVLETLGESGLEARISHLQLADKVNELSGRFKMSVEGVQSTARQIVDSPSIAYFCAEYGIHECLRIYAGGLGILAGDHCKSASDLGLSMVAVGILYREAYFTQLVDEEGVQRAYYRRDDLRRMGLVQIVDQSGSPETLSFPGPVGDVHFTLWRAEVGRVPLILLDTAIPPNPEKYQEYSSRLYGGDSETRIGQEMLLGIGGVRALRFLGYEPDLYHMNEGHSAFLSLELMREDIANGADLNRAKEAVRKRCLFTTHTPVPAGHDRFEKETVENHLGWMRRALSMSSSEFLGLGRIDVEDEAETFCMTVLALKCCAKANGVSRLHGRVSREMWTEIWPSVETSEAPIGYVTNGVHIASWMSPDMAALLDDYMGSGWRYEPWEKRTWEGIEKIPDDVLWKLKMCLKEKMSEEVFRHRLRRLVRLGRERDLEHQEPLDPGVLTIGFARRFATYKRGDLIFSDLSRARDILANPERPVQIIFAGKAHPQDTGGGEIIKSIIQAGKDPVLARHIFFLEDYGITIGRQLVQGVDLWLNNPRRPREACGTSGMKVPLNGGINVSTLDGWWCEGFGHQNGWVIGDSHTPTTTLEQDSLDTADLYRVLEEEIIPCFYERNAEGLPLDWIRRMKQSMKTIPFQFNSHRMVQDYLKQYYRIVL